MDENDAENNRLEKVDEDSRSAVNSLILDYYQKFGRIRDLEQFFALSTAQSDIRDPASLFWRKMKVQSDSSDSGEGKASSSTELCRISIKCSLPEHCDSRDGNQQSKDDSVSPPIIAEEAVSPLQTDHASPTYSENESIKSDDNNSQKSTEVHLEVSINKPFSPTSSITSQRKLEWDSLGDVGYGNENERKTSGSALSTLERLALHQQYSNNDSKHDTQFGLPTSQSTPVEPNISQKGKKGNIKKTKFYKKDEDFVEFNVPNNLENTGFINVNLTKHISFNVDKNGDFSVENSKGDIYSSPDKVSVETAMTPQIRIDKEIQTCLTQSNTQKDKSTNLIERQRHRLVCQRKFPIILNLNTLKKRKRRRKLQMFRKNLIKQRCNKSNLSPEKSINQISEAESFEYMPGHIYNENKGKNSNEKDTNSIGNRSSLESSVVFTTDSSKVNKNSFSKDLEKSINLLNDALQPKYSNSKLKEKLIKEVVQRLLKAKYSDDDSGSVFLSGLHLNSKNLEDPRSNHTTSTSDGNNFTNRNIVKRAKKSILRIDKFNPNGMVSTSQSTPNLHSFTQSEQPKNVHKTPPTSNTGSDFSSRERNSSDTEPKMSSDELYKKYLEALKREQAYKEHLIDREMLLRKKLASSDTCIKVIPEKNEKPQDRLYRLIKDLAQNNMNDGSGDASKVEGQSNSDRDQYSTFRKQRSHSVFTLAAGKSVPNSKHVNQKSCQNDSRGNSDASSSKILIDNCCICTQQKDPAICKPVNNVESLSSQKNTYCFYKAKNGDFTKHFVRSNKTSPRNTEKIVENVEDIQYVCLCPKEQMDPHTAPEKLLIYKCSRINQKPVCLDTLSKASSSIGIQCSSDCACSKQRKEIQLTTLLPDNTVCLNKELPITQSSSTVNCLSRKASTSSQTHANLDILVQREPDDKGESFTRAEKTCQHVIIKNDFKSERCGEYKPSRCNSKLCGITQSIQTRICINPKISNPSLSDVKFVNDLNSVTILNDDESCSSTLIEKCTEKNCNDSKNQLLATCNKTETLASACETQTECDVKYSNIVSIKQNERSNLQLPNEKQFSIPIHGTNMTLIVSLGSDTENISAEKKTKVKENCQVTNIMNSSDKEIIPKENYAKGVQSTSADFLTLINKKINESLSTITKDIKLPHEISQCINTCRDDVKYNTYPTKAQTGRKPFVRSNTYTSCLERSLRNIDSDKKFNVAVQATSQKSQNCHDMGDRNDDCSRNDQDLKISSIESKGESESESSKDPILKIIQDITKRYTKKDMEKSKRKKCYREIITVLNYLLDTEESSDQKQGCSSSCNTENTSVTNPSNEKKSGCTNKTYVDKGVQLSIKNGKKYKSCSESPEVPSCSEKPITTDSGTCKVLHKIKKECEKYHQKRCKMQCENKKCDESSSTSVNCENCNRVHYCSFRSKYKTNKAKSNVEKVKKKCVAYNLIIQTSDSVTSEGTVVNDDCSRPLKNVIVKVPSKHEHLCNAPFKEVSAKIEKKMPHCSPHCASSIHRCKSLPNDSERSSDDLIKPMRTCTVRDYLEMNRPDFIEKTVKRQNCLKVINQTRPKGVCDTQGLKMIVVHTPQCTHTAYMDPCNFYRSGVPMCCNSCVNPFLQSLYSEVTGIAKERAAKRKLLSQQLERQHTINTLSGQDLQYLARDLGAQLRRKKVAPKFISEREMKKHSEKIYKSLPEVVKKKEQLRKENVKRTNLLMANIFKKNLQMKTLQGSINLSNYSTVIKI